MKRWIQVIVILVGAYAMAHWGCKIACQSMGHSCCGNEESACGWTLQNLQVTQEQEKAIRPIEEKFQQQRQLLAKKIQGANERLAEMLLDKGGGLDGAAGVVAEINETQGKMLSLVFEHISDLRMHLTESQYRVLKEMAAKGFQQNAKACH